MTTQTPPEPRILFEASSFVSWRGNFSGIPRVVASVLWEWMRAETCAPRFFAYNSDSNVTMEFPPDGVIHHFSLYGYPGSTINRDRYPAFEELTGIESLLDSERENWIILPGASWIFPTLVQDLYALKSKYRLKIVSVAYDMIPTLLPHTFGPGFPEAFTATVTDLFWLSDLVLCISESTKRDSAEFCSAQSIPPPAFETFRLGDDIIKADAVEPDWFQPQWKSEPFLICVGTLEARKNHQLLYQAWKIMREQGFEKIPRIILVGRNGWLFDTLRYQIAHDPRVKEFFVIAEHCHDGHLRWLYENCLLTVYPSHYEGWGLPVTESLAYGKYCVTSPISSLPEAGGDYAGYFSPNDPAAWARHLMELIEHPEILAEKERHIAESYSLATWNTAAQQCWTAIQTHLAAS